MSMPWNAIAGSHRLVATPTLIGKEAHPRLRPDSQRRVAGGIGALVVASKGSAARLPKDRRDKP
jgi:hypothetical protein